VSYSTWNEQLDDPCGEIRANDYGNSESRPCSLNPDVAIEIDRLDVYAVLALTVESAFSRGS
jgi:hypothetical protein